MGDESERGFTVSDKRRFSSETGEPRSTETSAEEPSADQEARGAGAGPTADAPPRPGAASLPEISLTTFVMSLSTQALMHLGEIPSPVDGSTARDMVAAKQLIDILGMLRQRTAKDLEKAEEELFDNVLYDLRMRFVELSKSGSEG